MSKRLLDLGAAMVRTARLAAEHNAVCPVETETCVKCVQVDADAHASVEAFHVALAGREGSDALPDANEYPGLTILACQAMDKAMTALPRDVGVVVFTVHYGQGGALAYTATCDRERRSSSSPACSTARPRSLWPARRCP